LLDLLLLLLLLLLGLLKVWTKDVNHFGLSTKTYQKPALNQV
jgi:hypothetical protein